DTEQHPELHAAADAHWRDVRLESHRGYDASVVLQVDAVAVSPAEPCGPGGEEGSGGQLVSVMSHRARERAGDCRRVRTLWHDGRAAQSVAVVLHDHEVRAAAARQPEVDRRVGD